jgi:hypothetical protein
MDAFVDDYTRHSCSKAGCETAFGYEFNLRISVADKIGIGIGLGSLGTGTAGWDYPADDELLLLETPCVCCDNEIAAKRMVTEAFEPQSRRFDATSLILGLSALGTGTAFSVVYFEHPSNLGKAYLTAVACGLAASAYGLLVRLAARTRRRRHKTDEGAESVRPKY